MWDNLHVENGELVKHFVKRDSQEVYVQTVIPESLKGDVMYQYHNMALAGHMGTKKTKDC